MNEPHTHEAAHRRVAERFQATITKEGLAISGLLEADELLVQHGDQIQALSQEAFGFKSPEATQDWISRCARPIGFRAVVLTRQPGELVGFALGEPLVDLGNDMERAAKFVADQCQALGVTENSILYSNALAITPEHRGKGLGSGLALKAIQLCREQLHPDGALLFYRTKPDNIAANQASEVLGAQLTDIVSPNNKKLWFGYIAPAENTDSTRHPSLG